MAVLSRYGQMVGGKKVRSEKYEVRLISRIIHETRKQQPFGNE
jgi:hypothetical protein